MLRKKKRGHLIRIDTITFKEIFRTCRGCGADICMLCRRVKNSEFGYVYIESKYIAEYNTYCKRNHRVYF